MRPTSRVVTLWIATISLLTASLGVQSIASAQTAKSKHTLSHRMVNPVPATGPGKGHPPTTTDTWTGSGSNADWSNASNWNNGAITSGENILINVTTAATTDDASFTIGTLTLSNAGDSTTINGGVTLTAQGAITNTGTITNNGTLTAQSTISNTGTIALGNNTTTTIDGNISGAGTITLNSTGNFTELILGSNVTLSGGTMTLSNNSQNYIQGANALDQLTNQETIQGAGQIGHGQMALVNSGTIDANQSAGMTIDANDGFTNTGTVEATAGSTLVLSNTGTINNAGGTILANASTVQLNSSTVSGGNVAISGAGTLQLNTGTIHNGSTLTNSATGTIEVESGTNVLGGTINNSAGGTFKIDNNATLDLEGGTYSQLGTVQLNSSGNFTELVLEGNVTLSGGAVTLSNNSQNYIFGQISTDTLTNKETISGAGQIGHGQMTLVNAGTINSNQSTGITIQANGGVTNTGTLEATAGSTLALSSSGIINNTGGTISANTGTVQVNSSTVSGGNIILTGASTLQLNTAVVHGGTVTNSATGTIEIASGTNTLGGTINNSAGGTFKIDNNATLDLEGGTYSQLGALQLNSSGNFTELVLDGDVTLSGGSVTLSNNSQNYIFGQISSDTLTNQETIQGAGQIGHGQMTLVNTGTINSNQSSGITIQANGGVTNTGTLEATSGATLTLSSTGVVNNAGGTITANTGTLQVNSSTVNGGAVTLVGASSLQLNTGVVHGGTVTNSSAGTIEIASGTNTMGGTINNSAGGIFKIDNNATLDLEGGAYAQLGAVQLNSSGNFTELVLDGNVTLSGGTVTLSNNAQNYIFGATSSNTLTNQETIQGAGQIGHGVMTLVNSGTINSNQSAGLTIQANGGVTNTGTLEATSGATLTLSSTGVVNNAGGTITANTGTLQVNSSTVIGGAIMLVGASSLQLNTATIKGGTVTNSSTGTIEIASGANTMGGTINNSAGGIFKIDNNATLFLGSGTYSQLGAVQLNSSGNFTELVLDGNVTFSGGTVTLSNNFQNYIFGQTSSNTLNNQETIQGAGQIGHGQMTLVNSGTINSNGTSGMTIQANGGVTNTGTLEATSGATLALSSSGVINNTGGIISANTGTVQVNSSTVSGGAITLTGASLLQLNTSTIHGGSTITNSSTGTIEIASGANVLGGTINNSAGGILKIDNNATLDLESGSYSQLGAVQLNSSGNLTELVIEGPVTLGGGTITMSGNANNFILAAAPSDILTNQATIQGAGNIGNGQMGLVNAGTILANASGNLLINVNGQNVSNTGVLEADGATLTIQGPGVTFLTNDNQSTGTLTGGTYIADGSNIQWNAGINGISTLAANVTVEGGGQLFNTCTGCTTNMLAGLTSITSTGSLTIGGLAFTDTGAFSNAGSLTLLPSESFTVGSLSQISGGSLTTGTYVLDANLTLSGTAQTITTNAATLTLAGGTIENASNSTNALAGLATNSGKLTIGGASNNVSTTAASFSNTGTLTINGNDSFTAAKLTQISGTTLSAGTYVLGGNLDLTTAGISVTTNSATLTLQGGTINSNSVNALAALAKNTKTLTVAGSANNVSTTAATFANSGSVTVNAGDTLTLNGTGHTYSQTAGTTTVDGTLTATTITATGGSIFGAGTLAGNTSVGNATGTAVTLNVGDNGKAGLLAITGTYTQLATGTMKVSIGGLTTGTYSALSVSGNASLGGTLTAAIVNGLVLNSGNIGDTFTILTTTGTLTGTFTNGTVTSGTDVFTVSYTGNSAVLTLTSVTGPGSKNQPTSSQAIVATPKLTSSRSRVPVLASSTNRARQISTSKLVKSIMVAALGRSNAVIAGSSGTRIWDHIPAVGTVARPVLVSKIAVEANTPALHNTVAVSTGWMGGNHSIGAPPTMGWMGTSNNRRVPVKVMPPVLPRIAR